VEVEPISSCGFVSGINEAKKASPPMAIAAKVKKPVVQTRPIHLIKFAPEPAQPHAARVEWPVPPSSPASEIESVQAFHAVSKHLPYAVRESPRLTCSGLNGRSLIRVGSSNPKVVSPVCPRKNWRRRAGNTKVTLRFSLQAILKGGILCLLKLAWSYLERSLAAHIASDAESLRALR